MKTTKPERMKEQICCVLHQRSAVNTRGNKSSYLSTGDREICKDAVLLIFMAGVRFQALKCWKNNEKLHIYSFFLSSNRSLLVFFLF